MAAIVVGAAISSVAAVLLWQAVAHPDCALGAVRAPIDWVLPSLLVGVVIGAGLAASGLLAVALVRGGHSWLAAVLGAAAELMLVFVAIVAAAAVLMVPACQRPPI